MRDISEPIISQREVVDQIQAYQTTAVTSATKERECRVRDYLTNNAALHNITLLKLLMHVYNLSTRVGGREREERHSNRTREKMHQAFLFYVASD